MIHASRATLKTVAVAVALGVSLVGCGGRATNHSATGTGTRSSQSTGTVTTSAQSNCHGGVGRPLQPRAVLAVFRHHGFSVKATTNESDCLLAEPSATAYVVTNTPEGLPPDEFNRIQDSEGSLYCEVSQTPSYGPWLQKNLHAPANSPIYNGRKAEASFSNVHCLLYAGDARQAEQVKRFDRAVTELARSVGASHPR
jgi:hypothetical protein